MSLRIEAVVHPPAEERTRPTVPARYLDFEYLKEMRADLVDRIEMFPVRTDGRKGLLDRAWLSAEVILLWTVERRLAEFQERQ